MNLPAPAPVPWWALSPSPFSFAFWLVLALLETRPVFQGTKRRAIKQLASFVAAAMRVGMVVLLFDSLWDVFQLLRFGYLVPEGVLVLELSILRNLGWFGWCVLMSLYQGDLKKGVFRVDFISVMAWFVLLVYMGTWFWVAGDPSWTDWTYAIRYNGDRDRIVRAFILSHLGAKFLQGLIFFSHHGWRFPNGSDRGGA